MLFTIYFVSALITGFLFSFVTSMLMVFGIERTGGDPGTPAIMLVSLMCVCVILSIITASIMGVAKEKYKKEFSAKFSAILFLLMYFPIHIVEFYFPDGQSDFLAATLAIMLFLSYIPLFHMVAQALTNLYEFFEKRKRTT